MSPYRSVVGLDLDGTIIDHTRSKIRLAKKYGFSLTPEETVSEVMKDHVPSDIYKKITSELYGEATLHSPIMEGAKEVIERLMRQARGVYVVSRRGQGGEHGPEVEAARAWLAQHIGLRFARENTFFVKTDEEKDAVARELGISVFLDDKISVLEALKSVPRKAFFDQYGTLEHIVSKEYQRVTSWGEFFDWWRGIRETK